MNIKYKNSQYQNVNKIQASTSKGIAESTSSFSEITARKFSEDLGRVVLEYCDKTIYPAYNEQTRDLWLLNRVKRFKIRYFEEI